MSTDKTVRERYDEAVAAGENQAVVNTPEEMKELARLIALKQDVVNHPSHYTQGKIEVIDFIEDQDLPYHAGNVIKYVTRYRHKNGIEDLKKARWYLDRLITNLEESKDG